MARNAFGLESEPADLDEMIDQSLADADDREASGEVSGGGEVPEPAEHLPPETPGETSEPEPALDRSAAEEVSPSEGPGVVEPEGEDNLSDDHTPYAGRYATSYKSLEAFEEGHRNALDMHRQAVERAKAAEARAREAEEYLRVAAQYIQEQQNQPKQQKTASEIAAEAERYGLDEDTYKAVESLAEKMFEERVGPVQQNVVQQQQEFQLAQHRSQAEQAINRFRTAHANELTDVIEQSMVDVFARFDLDPVVADNYEIAYEAATNPALYRELSVNPHFIDTDEGMEYARERAGSGAPATPAESRAAQLAADRKRAQVESGNPGAPTQMDQRKSNADDPNSWEAVLKLAANENKNAFGLTK